MANEKLKKAAGPLKIAGGVLFLAASVSLMWHRMPKHEYAAVHEDKPRAPKPDRPSAPTTPTLAKPVEKAAVAAARPAAVPTAGLVHASAADPAAAPPAPQPVADAYDWRDDCKSEIGILCHSVPPKGLVRCLEPYGDALMSACRGALAGRTPASAAH